MRNNNWFNTLVYAMLAGALLTASFAAGYFTRIIAEREQADFPLVAEARRILEANYLGSLPPYPTLQHGAVRGMLSTIGDPYTIFLEPSSQELETQSLQGEFGGIGVKLRRNESGEVVLSPYPDLPAAQTGILEGDILEAVDGRRITADMSLDLVTALIRGDIGSQVVITVRRGSTPPHDFTLMRQAIEIPSVTWRMLDENRSVGLLQISRFSDKTASEARRALDDLKRRGATNIVLDLRGNGGGLLSSMIDTASLFLNGGTIMIEARRGQAEKVYSAPAHGADADLNLVVLVNDGTASAAEILAGALRDRGRAPLIGQTTFGKGSVQLIFKLSDGSSMHVTNALWYTPRRAIIDKAGLKPDIEVPPADDGSDPELQRAIAYLEAAK